MQAVLKQREAELVNAESSLERGKSLSNMNVLSQADLDKLNSDALAKRATVDSARADLEASSLRLKFTHVTAPDDGVITSRTVTVGQIAQAGGEMLRLLRNNRIEWRGEIPEARITDLKAGQPATIVTADGKSFKGTIRVVAPTISSNNRTGLVDVDLPPDERLRPGMFARGEIELGRAPAFTVPLRAGSPSRRVIGIGSPVSAASSIMAPEAKMIPSTGMTSPARTRMTSPTTTCSIGISAPDFVFRSMVE